MPIFGSAMKCGIVFRRKSCRGTKSASKIATNSPRARASPSFSAPALISRPVRPADLLDVESLLAVPFDVPGDDVDGLIRGIVQHLNLQFLLRIDHGAGGIDQAADDIELVEDRELHGDHGIGGDLAHCRALPGPELQVVVDHDEAVRSEDKQDRQREDVGEENDFFHDGVLLYLTL